ncbi:S-layer homology domain-containing protein [Cohnella suwonensis]|uniref:S-layer homology domain-containing protein n=1 Tax=Cohnella suwonensis TaxID=696072 RepID=A0ABW0LYD1_9BACL
MRRTGNKVMAMVMAMLMVLGGMPGLLVPGGSKAYAATVQAWQDLGSAGFSAGEAGYTSLYVATDGTPYVAYSDAGNSNKATVMKYDGTGTTGWVPVGSAGFSAGSADFTSLYVAADGTPYVAYMDGGNSYKATVMKYDGTGTTGWVPVGSAGFSAGEAPYTSLYVAADGTPYVAYMDAGNSYKATVKKYDGTGTTGWVPVGSAGFSAGQAEYTSLYVAADGTPYVAYRDAGNSYNTTVKKYDGTGTTGWVPVGSAGFSAGQANYTSLYVAADGTPYVAYRDLGNSYKATVMKYDGTGTTGWVPVGSAGFSAGMVNYMSLSIATDGTPYVAYMDDGNSNKATVMKYDGTGTTGWVTVGSAGFSAGSAYFTSLYVAADGTPYVAYMDGGNSNKATVMRLNNVTASPSLTADTTDADMAHDIEVTFTDDAVWRGAITTVKDGTTLLTAGTDYTVSAGKITINAGVLPIGSHTITIKATGYADATVVQTVSKAYVGEGNIPAETVYPGTDVAFPNGLDDSVSDALPIGFDFNFYGTSYNQIYASTNGLLMFSNPSSTTGVGSLPSSNPDHFIAPFSDDLYLDQHSKVMYTTIGDAPNRKFVIQYTNMKFCCDDSGDPWGTFQAVLYESTNEIQFQYPNLLGTQDGDRAFSSHATIAIQGPTGNYVKYSQATDSISEKQAIRFSPNTDLSSYQLTGQANYEPILINDGLFPGSPALVSPTYGSFASLNPTLEWNNATGATSYRLLIATDPEFLSTSIVQDQSGITQNTVDVTGLLEGTTYYWKVAATNLYEITFSNTFSFVATSIFPATVDTDANVTSITSTTATAGGNVTSDGGGTVTERGVVYSLNANPTVNDGKFAADSGGTGTFSVNLTGLQPVSTYHLRAYAINDLVTSYGPDVTFTTDKLNDNALLSDMAVGQGELSPAFSSTVLNYSVDVANAATSLDFTFTPADPSQTITVTGATFVSVTDSVYSYSASNLNVGANPIQIVVTAEDGTQNPYQLTVNRISSNADLSGLTLSSGTLSPDFASEKTEYSANVANGVSNLTVTGSVYDSHSTLTVNGTAAASSVINLNVGNNTITIVVTAQDGISKKTYTVTVTRAPASTTGSVGGGGGDGGKTSDKVISTNGNLTLPVGKTGEVSLEDAVTISIPAGASGKEQKVTIDKVLDTQKLLTKKEVLLSQIYEILKNFPENFDKPVTLSFVFDPASLKGNQKPVVFYYDEVKKEWVKVGGNVNGNKITVEVNHFTKYAVIAVDSAEDVPPTPTTEVNFSDISGIWAEASIKQAVSLGIVKGYADGTFRPGKTVTRAEFSVMLMNALKPQEAEAKLAFTDSAKIGAWAQKAVAQAVQAGIIKGYKDGSFRPNAEITRAEMAAMIANALKLTIDSDAVAGFADDKNIPSWAKGAVAVLKQLGVIGGKSGNTFDPAGKATRAEAVTVLMKMLAQKSK